MAVAQYDPVYDRASFTVSFHRDTELTGNMKLKLWVSASEGGDMDLFSSEVNLGTHSVHTGSQNDPTSWSRSFPSRTDPRLFPGLFERYMHLLETIHKIGSEMNRL
jgi:hypothetical protein